MSHKTYKLSEICYFQGGYSFKSGEYQRTSENSYDVFRMGNIARGGGINHNANHAYINKSKCDGLGKFILQKNDLVMSMTDMKSSMALLGHTALIPEGGQFILNQRVGMLRIKDPNVVDIRYLYYFTNLDEHIQNLRSRANSGVQVNLTATAILESLISLPPISEQRAIAGILGALDDKIELNRRMNRTLESTARAVFHQWFVESEKVDDWEVGKLRDVTENIRRSANAGEIEPDANYIGLEHMPRGSIALSEWGNASELASNKFIFKAGEFLFGKLRPYFHKVGIAPIDGVCSTDILVIAPKSPGWYGFVLGHISSVELINYTNAASTGTKMPRTNWSDIANYEVAIPPLAKAKEFSEIFLPMAQQIQANIMESRTLASLRDSLLPKLMKGEVRVKDVEGVL